MASPQSHTSEPVRLATFSALPDRVPSRAQVGEIELVIVRLGEEVSVLYGRCTHRNALLAEGRIEGEMLVCEAHGWDYHCRTGASPVDPEESLARFEPWIEDDGVWVDGAAVRRWRQLTPRDFLDDELAL